MKLEYHKLETFYQLDWVKRLNDVVTTNMQIPYEKLISNPGL